MPALEHYVEKLKDETDEVKVEETLSDAFQDMDLTEVGRMHVFQAYVQAKLRITNAICPWKGGAS